MKRQSDRWAILISWAAGAGTPGGFGDTMVWADRDGIADEGHRNDATAQDIWAILRELFTSERETNRRMQETNRRMQETDELLKRQAIEPDRRIRKLDELTNGQWRRLREALVRAI